MKKIKFYLNFIIKLITINLIELCKKLERFVQSVEGYTIEEKMFLGGKEMKLIKEQLLKISIIRRYFGDTAQKKKVMEELRELSDEIRYELSTGSDNRDRIINELADVYIMLEQLQMIKKISIMEIDKMINYKIERTLKRIDEEKKGKK